MAQNILSTMRRAALGLVRRLPEILFGFAFAVAFLTYGYFISASHIFPFRQIKFAFAAVRALDAAAIIDPGEYGVGSLSHVLLRDMAKTRITALAPKQFSENFLMTTWADQFPDACPGKKCLAVEISRDGNIIGTIPYRPAELDKPRLADLPYERSAVGEAAFPIPWGLQQLPGGDLIVTFGLRNAFPFGGGVARIRRDGTFVWFRSDYTHHWPNIIGPNEIAVTGSEIRDGGFKVRINAHTDFDIDCPTRHYADTVRVLDFDGHIREEFSALDMLVHSPARAILASSAMPCDPIHLNYATVVGPELASQLAGVSPRDFLLSFYEVSSLAIVSRTTHKLLHLYRGPFVHQHAVTPEHGSKVLVFDNLGSDGLHEPSRLVEYDLATGASRVVFPTGVIGANTYSEVRGTIALSPDKQRALTCFSMEGVCYEIRLSDGKPLMKFDNLGDARKLDAMGPDRFRYAAHYFVNGLYYAQ